MVQGTLRDTFHRRLDESDAVLVGAGAGPSAAAGTTTATPTGSGTRASDWQNG